MVHLTLFVYGLFPLLRSLSLFVLLVHRISFSWIGSEWHAHSTGSIYRPWSTACLEMHGYIHTWCADAWHLASASSSIIYLSMEHQPNSSLPLCRCCLRIYIYNVSSIHGILCLIDRIACKCALQHFQKKNATVNAYMASSVKESELTRHIDHAYTYISLSVIHLPYRPPSTVYVIFISNRSCMHGKAGEDGISDMMDMHMHGVLAYY